MILLIRKYYLALFVGFFFLFFIRVLITKSPNSFWVNLLVCLGGALIISLSVGTLSYFLDTKWGPAKRKKMMSKSPFADLFLNGFIQQDDMAIGKLHDYTVIVNYIWPGGTSCIKLDVLFDIEIHGSMTTDLIKEVSKRNKPNRFTGIPFEWTKNSIGCTFQYNFKPPTYEKLIRKADEIIQILKKENLHPMTYEKALLLQSKPF